MGMLAPSAPLAVRRREASKHCWFQANEGSHDFSRKSIEVVNEADSRLTLRGIWFHS